MDLELARLNTIKQQIQPWKIHDKYVLQALKSIPRDQFVSPQHKNLAFADTELPILAHQKRYLLSPKIEAHILQALLPYFRFNQRQNILMLGADLGYLPCVLAKFNQPVCIIEENDEILNLVHHNLNHFKIEHHIQKQSVFDPINAQFNIIFTTSSVEQIPENWLNSLNNNGILVCFVGEKPVLELQILRKKNQTIQKNVILETWVEPFANLPKHAKFAF
jgi:protein-L-isoaspartate(D-aspartate) O-methyltransferase